MGRSKTVLLLSLQLILLRWINVRELKATYGDVRWYEVGVFGAKCVSRAVTMWGDGWGCRYELCCLARGKKASARATMMIKILREVVDPEMIRKVSWWLSYSSTSQNDLCFPTMNYTTVFIYRLHIDILTVPYLFFFENVSYFTWSKAHRTSYSHLWYTKP